MTYAFDPKAEAGARVSDVMVGGAAIDMDKMYGVVSNNYVRNGGDGYAMFKTADNAYDYGPDLADVTAEFLAAKGPFTFLQGCGCLASRASTLAQVRAMRA